jgi:hypothetical protein
MLEYYEIFFKDSNTVASDTCSEWCHCVYYCPSENETNFTVCILLCIIKGSQHNNL